MPVVRRLAAWAVLICFAGSFGWPLAGSGHLVADSDTREPSLVVWHPVTQFEPVRPGPEAEHCAVCHWLRSLADTAVSVPVSYVPHVAEAAGPAGVLAPIRPVALGGRSVRGPPPALA